MGDVYRLTRQTQPTASLFTKPMTVEMPSPVDSGLGPEIMVTPKQEAHDVRIYLNHYWHDQTTSAPVVQAFGYDMHGGIVQTINQRNSNKEYASPRQSSTDRIVTNRESPVNIPKM